MGTVKKHENNPQIQLQKIELFQEKISKLIKFYLQMRPCFFELRLELHGLVV
jgi:hypothetical protein